MHIETGSFMLDSGPEHVILSGDYEIKLIENEHRIEEETENINCQAIYLKGNVFYRTKTENIESFVRLFIKYTYDPCKDLETQFDFSVKSIQQMIGGTICPTKKVLFAYKNKVFVAYGRYIFGYDKTFVRFKREIKFKGIETEKDTDSENEATDSENDETDSENEDHENSQEIGYYTPYNDTIRKSAIEKNKIILGVPKSEIELDDYVYSFMIYDQKSGILDAFGLYR